MLCAPKSVKSSGAASAALRLRCSEQHLGTTQLLLLLL
jgi:hypothetical protein